MNINVKAQLKYLVPLALIGCLSALPMVGCSNDVNDKQPKVTVQEVRGRILDREGKVLAFSDKDGKRIYPEKELAASVLGFVGVEKNIGLAGVELQLDSMLKGDSKGNKPVNVQLTLDRKIQSALEKTMDEAVKSTRARSAAAIVMDPKTGEILGMVSRPDFDPNKYDKYQSKNWENQAISMAYEPGPAFEPIVGSIGLTLEKVTPQTIFQDPGKIRVTDCVISNWDGKAYGSISFADIVKKSVNTGYVQLGMHIGKKGLMEYAEKFGFGNITGVELPREESGIIYRWQNMWDQDLATASIGHGIAVTPIQMLRAFSVNANDGQLVQPYIVHKITEQNGKLLNQGEKKVVRTVISPDTAAKMRSMMPNTVSGNTEKLAEGGGYDKENLVSSCVGFVSADKEQQYAMIVVLDIPKGDDAFSTVLAEPVFKKAMEKVLETKGSKKPEK